MNFVKVNVSSTFVTRKNFDISNVAEMADVFLDSRFFCLMSTNFNQLTFGVISGYDKRSHPVMIITDLTPFD